MLRISGWMKKGCHLATGSKLLTSFSRIQAVLLPHQTLTLILSTHIPEVSFVQTGIFKSDLVHSVSEEIKRMWWIFSRGFIVLKHFTYFEHDLLTSGNINLVCA